jgi:hypothetical protein
METSKQARLLSDHVKDKYIHNNRVESPELPKRKIDFSGFDFNPQSKFSTLTKNQSEDSKGEKSSDEENNDRPKIDC